MTAPFQTLRRNPGPVFGSGLLVQLVVAIITVAVLVPYSIWWVGRIESAATVDDINTILTGGFGMLALIMLIPIGVSLAGSAFLQGIMVVEVASGTLGRRFRLGELWRRAARRIGPLLGWVAIVSLSAFLVLTVLVGIIVAAAFVSPLMLILGVVLTFLLGLGALVLFAWLYTKLSLTPSAIVIEGLGLRAAMRRSWRLTDGNFWRVLGVQLLVGVIVNIAAQIVSAPLSFAGGILPALIDPTDTGAAIVVLSVIGIVSIVLTLVVSAIATVALAALVALLYLDLRMRKEGLDLELQRYVEQGADPAVDPFVARA